MTTRVTSKGQVVIPAALRRRLGIRRGTTLLVEERDGNIVLKPTSKEYYVKLAGVISDGPSLAEDLLRERASEKEREERPQITVLDTHALLVYLREEPGLDLVAQCFAEADAENTKVLMTTVNVGEAFYIILRRHSHDKLAEVEERLACLPIAILPADLPLAKEAAEIKATRKMSFADCFAAALAKMRGGRVVTGDPEFKEVEAEIPILWLSPTQ